MSKNRKEMEDALVAKATKDPAFRRSLLADPRAAVAKEFGVDLPAQFQVKVLEENDNSIYLVLPAGAPQSGGELSEEQLSGVAGGMVNPCSYTTSSRC